MVCFSMEVLCEMLINNSFFYLELLIVLISLRLFLEGDELSAWLFTDLEGSNVLNLASTDSLFYGDLLFEGLPPRDPSLVGDFFWIGAEILFYELLIVWEREVGFEVEHFFEVKLLTVTWHPITSIFLIELKELSSELILIESLITGGTSLLNDSLLSISS